MAASSKPFLAAMMNELSISEEEAQSRVNALVKTLAVELGRGNHIELRGFGSLTASMQYDVPITNPQNGEKTLRSRAVRVTFSPFKPLIKLES